MPFVPVANTAEFAVVQELFGQQVINTFMLQRADPWDVAELAIACADLRDAFIARFFAQLSADLKGVKVTARDLTTVNGAVAEVNFPANTVGLQNSPALPGGVAITIAHKTNIAGRSYRGRTSLAGIGEAHVTGNALTTAMHALLQTAVNSFATDLSTDGYIWGVASRYSGYTQSPPKYKKVPTPRAAGIFTTYVTHEVKTNVGSMDSRMAGVGA